MNKIAFAAWVNLILVSVFAGLGKYELAIAYAIIFHGFVGLLKEK